jgi:hypothetical protein
VEVRRRFTNPPVDDCVAHTLSESQSLTIRGAIGTTASKVASRTPMIEGAEEVRRVEADPPVRSLYAARLVRAGWSRIQLSERKGIFRRSHSSAQTDLPVPCRITNPTRASRASDTCRRASVGFT